VKSLGPLQCGGSVVFESASPDIGLPSADVNATVIVWLAPTITETGPPTDGVAVTGWDAGLGPPPALKPAGALLPPPPPLAAPEPLLLRAVAAVPVLTTSKLQPPRSDSVQMPPSMAR
jgi:hypothetical protein